MDDAYIELGLAPGASDAEVKAAWRRMVSRWHPDRNASAEAAALIQRINGAYERIRLASVSAGVGAAAEGRVVQRRVRLAIEDAVLGCTRVLRGRLVEACVACGSSGVRGVPQRCGSCGGSGRRRADWWVAWPPAPTACGDCDGAGTRRQACPACAGAGQQTMRYRCTVRLPAGLRHGDQLAADGGGSHRGGFDGRLALRIELAAHALFQIGDDGLLHGEFPVDGFAWLAQRRINVPAPCGLQPLQLRRGCLVYRLPGHGLPLQRGSRQRADYLVTLVPSFPDLPDAEQQALLERLAAISDVQPPPALRAWRHRLQAWARGRPVPR
ncbi:MAG: DnaJ C-terminal domain-containing protein [Pseudomonadota bacterium]